jgi:hypothetical protein
MTNSAVIPSRAKAKSFRMPRFSLGWDLFAITRQVYRGEADLGPAIQAKMLQLSTISIKNRAATLPLELNSTI